MAKLNGRLPVQQPIGQRDVRPAMTRIVLRQRLTDDLRPGAGHFNHRFRELADGEFGGVTEIDWSRNVVSRIHQTQDALDQIVNVTKGPRLHAVAVYREILSAAPAR